MKTISNSQPGFLPMVQNFAISSATVKNIYGKPILLSGNVILQCSSPL